MIPPYFLRIIYEQQKRERMQIIKQNLLITHSPSQNTREKNQVTQDVWRQSSRRLKSHAPRRFARSASTWPGPFFTIWSGQSLAMITSETVQFALIWWLTEAYGSAILVSIATMMALLPRAILGPVIGALADRWNRRKVLLISHLVIILALIALGGFFRMGAASVGAIYLIILVCACSKSFQMPAMMSSTTLMVPENYLTRVAGLNQMVQGIIRVAAPALGAVLVNSLPMETIVIVDIAGAFLAVLVLFITSMPNPVHKPDTGGSLTGWRSLWADMRVGVQYVWRWHGAAEMLVISTAINFLSCPAFMLTSILVTQRFGGSVQEFGLMGAAIGSGMILGGMMLSAWKGFQRPMQTSLIGIIGMAIAMLVTGLAPGSAFWAAAGGMLIGGFMVPVCMAPIQALIQKTVEPAIQGRVLTLFDSASTAISPLSLAVSGPVFEQLGAHTWYIGGGCLSLLIGILGFSIPRVLNLGMKKNH